jgi:hypothetical protein
MLYHVASFGLLPRNNRDARPCARGEKHFRMIFTD